MWRSKEREKSDGRVRILRVPCAPLKAALRKLNRELLQNFDRNPHCFCRAKSGVLAAVRSHQRHPALMHRDISSFFPSVTRLRVLRTLQRLGFSDADAALIADVCTVDDQLPQGSPASVTLGNLVLIKLDCRIGTLCAKHGMTYTRYVDDVAVSGGHGRLAAILALVDRIISDDGWECGAKGGVFVPGQYREYLGVSVGGTLKPGRKSSEKALKAHQDLECGAITHAEFLSRTAWTKKIGEIGQRTKARL